MTIHEVAERAGVSPMTLSRVVNGNANVRSATRELVMRTVRELNYTPNAAARSLAAAQGTRIALIYTNPSSAYLSELLVGALDGASTTATQLVLDTWDHTTRATERAAARKIAQSVAGVILPPPLCESKAVCSELVAAGIPVVAIASGRFQPDISGVRSDDWRAAQEMTEHWLCYGHQRIAFIKGNPNQSAVWPELTTIRQPIAAMAASSVELLLRSIRRRKDGEGRVVLDHVVAHLLVKRDSVGAPITP